MALSPLKMIQKQTCGWFVLAAVISCSIAVSLGDTVTATIGEPLILRFGYRGRRRGVTYHFSKDDQPFVLERPRVFRRFDRLSFVEITDTDAGEYHLLVEGRRVRYSKAINLIGMHMCNEHMHVNSLLVDTYICTYSG